MKMIHMLGIFYTFITITRGAETNAFHPLMSVENVALLPNPTTDKVFPGGASLRLKIDSLLIHGSDLYEALTNLLLYAENYMMTQTPSAESSLSSVRDLHDASRVVTVYYASYQQFFSRNGLKADVKKVVEEILLYTLKKMEWIAVRKENPVDDYFNYYFYTQLRYREVSGGWLMLNGVFKQVPTERANL